MEEVEEDEDSCAETGNCVASWSAAVLGAPSRPELRVCLGGRPGPGRCSDLAVVSLAREEGATAELLATTATGPADLVVRVAGAIFVRCASVCANLSPRRSPIPSLGTYCSVAMHLGLSRTQSHQSETKKRRHPDVDGGQSQTGRLGCWLLR